MPTGTGLVERGIDWLHIVAAVLFALAILLIFVGVVLRARRAEAVLFATVGTVLALSGAGIGVQPGPQFGDAWGLPVGGGNDSHNDLIVTAAPGEPFIFSVLVVNNRFLPVRIDGVVLRDGTVPTRFPGWTMATAIEDTEGALLPADTAAVIQPFDLKPGKYAQLNLVGHADSCSDPNSDSGSTMTTAQIDVAYDYFGLSSATTITVPDGVTELVKDDCSA